MSSASVINTTMASTAARMSPVRSSGATSFQLVDQLDTNIAARGRDQYDREDELEDFEVVRPRRRRYRYLEAVKYSGIFVSREVGTTMVQAQAAASRMGAPTMAPGEAERNVALYEFNQSLIGAPEVSTNTGVMH